LLHVRFDGRRDVGKLKMNTGMTVVRRVVPRALRERAFASAIIAAVVIGGGLRLVPTGVAAVAGSNAGGQGAASTACAAS
jgi:hypothetical protein